MAVGIYALYWPEQDLVYIGKSEHLNLRFTRHRYKLKSNSHVNYKVQNAYDLYGLPSFEVLELCKIDELHALEDYYIKEFDAIKYGLNILNAKPFGSGTEGANSKYSKIQLLKVLACIYKYKYTCEQTSIRTGVGQVSIRMFIHQQRHAWAGEQYPEQLYLARIALAKHAGKHNDSGIRANNSKYSKKQILKVLVGSYKYGYTRKDNAARSGLTESAVKNILTQRTHTWLEKEFPEALHKAQAASSMLKGQGGHKCVMRK